MPRCRETKPDRTPCERIVSASQSYCYSHDPNRQEERKRNASKAGKSKHSRELVQIKQRLSDLADDVLGGRVDRANAAVCGQLYNTLIRGLSVELKVREIEELERRMEELEAMLERQNKSRGYGA